MDMDDNFLNSIDEKNTEEVYEEIIESSQSSEQESFILSEAIKRIEQAKLYETLLKHKLFGPNSARPEIISVVENEIKQFILQRLEILLGMKTENNSSNNPDFTPEQVEALKILANKVLLKNESATKTTNPTILQVNKPTNENATITPVKAFTDKDRPTGNSLSQNNTVIKPETPTKPLKTGRRKSNNVSSITGQDFSQAVNPNNPPKKMPSQAEINAMNNKLAMVNSGSIAGAGDVKSQILALAIAGAQQKNKDIIEE